MKQYSKPKIEVIVIDSADIITTSGGTGYGSGDNDVGGSGLFGEPNP